MFEFSWDVDRKKFFEFEKMKTQMQNEMGNTLTDYATQYQTDKIQTEILGELGLQYENTKRVIGAIKRGLNNTIDSMNVLVIKPF